MTGALGDISGVTVRGPGTAELIVFLHGGMVNRHIWESVVRRLDASYLCVSMDLPGHGDLVDEENTIDHALDRIDLVSEALERDRTALAGISLGGYVAQAYTARDPSRVSGLLLDGATMSLTGWVGVLARSSWFLIPTVPNRAAGSLENHLKSLMEPEVFDNVVEGGFSPKGGYESLKQLYRRDFASEMRGYAGPIVVMNGEDDKYNRKAEAAFVAQFPQTESIVIAGAGHGASAYDPDAAAEAVRILMKRASQGGTQLA